MSYAFSLLLIILAESNFNGTGTQVFGTVRYSVLGILVMANADGMRGVSGRNCSAVCCVPPRDSMMAWQVESVWRLLEGSWFIVGEEG